DELLTQLRNKAAIALGCHLTHDVRLDGLAHEACINNRGLADLANESASLWPDLKQSFLGELDEGFTHRLAADRESPRYLGLRKRGARGNLAANDALPEPDVNLRPHGTGQIQRPGEIARVCHAFC